MARALEIQENRAARIRHFGSAMFGEPAWDMLLLLYIRHDKARISATGLAMESGSSRSSGLRWLDYLEQRRFVSREQHPTDRRITFVELSEEGREVIEDYLARTLRAPGVGLGPLTRT